MTDTEVLLFMIVFFLCVFIVTAVIGCRSAEKSMQREAVKRG